VSVRIIPGDCREILTTLPDESVNCCVTSPPYWGLRDYGCEGQIGLEPTPEAYVAELVAVFREVRRVLRADGTVWINLGDTYSRDAAKGGSGPNGKHDFIPDYGNARRVMSEAKGSSDGKVGRGDRAPVRVGAGLEQKNLVGIPWRVAFALQADGWYLRSDIIWAKPNPMPESVTDRPTKAHEYVFLLTKSARYRFDAGAIAEPVSDSTLRIHSSPNVQARAGAWKAERNIDRNDGTSGTLINGVGRDLSGRNARTVWTIATQPFSGAHFATMPPKLAERCILAGCPEGGTVLDPFGGAGTTGLVADRLGRNAVLIELNTAYGGMAYRRIEGDAPLLAEVDS